MNSENTSERPNHTAKVGIYWRTSLRMFAPIHPGIMTFNDGRVSFKTKDRLVFEKSISEIEAVFTLLGTLVVTVDGAKYSFITGNSTSVMHQPFTPEQIQELQEANHEAKDGTGFLKGAGLFAGGIAANNLLPNIGGRVLGVAGKAAGTVIMYKEQYAGFKLLLSWANYLEKNGLKTIYKTKSYAKMQIILWSIAIPSLALLTALTYLLVVHFS
jgi:hypothetical protein